jgi:hypothetical protein
MGGLEARDTSLITLTISFVLVYIINSALGRRPRFRTFSHAKLEHNLKFLGRAVV